MENIEFVSFDEMFDWAVYKELIKVDSNFDKSIKFSLHDLGYTEFIRQKYNSDIIEYNLRNLIKYLHHYKTENEKLQNKEKAERKKLQKIVNQGNAEIINLDFEDLFDEKCRLGIDKFIVLLRQHEYINDDDELIINPIVDFSRIYYYLIDKRVIKIKFSRGSKGIKVYYNRFKTMVNEKAVNGELSVTRVNATNQDAQNFNLIKDKDILFEIDKIFK